MPAKSKKQQQFMGIVYRCKNTGDCPDSKIKEVAKSMSKKDIRGIAKTKHKGLPKKVKKKKNKKEASRKERMDRIKKLAETIYRDDDKIYNVDKLIKIANELDKRGLKNEADLLDKFASKHSGKKAKGLNWSYAEEILLESEVEPSREDVLAAISENPFFSKEDIQNITNIQIEYDLAERLNKKEKIFLEIGGYLNDSLSQFNEIKDYLMTEKDLKEPGDLSEIIEVDLTNPERIKELFLELNNAQLEWHKEASERDKRGLNEDRYLTHEVVHDFGDGWEVVYLPAVGEGPNYRGDNRKSNDRTVEGNINGLCLGKTQGLYQDNSAGKMYSVRDPRNKPRATIRIGAHYDENRFRLFEAKGKNNMSPDTEGAMHANIWFESQTNLEYKGNHDYISFPPTSIEDAKEKFSRNPAEAYRAGWIVHWYRKGILELDEDVRERIASNDRLVIWSGLGKKYKELVQPVVEFHTKDFISWAEGSELKVGDKVRFVEGTLSSLKGTIIEIKKEVFRVNAVAFGREVAVEVAPVEIEKIDREISRPNVIFGTPNVAAIHELSHESWKTYKKEPWMKRAVTLLFRLKSEHAFKLGLSKIPQYLEAGRRAAKEMATVNSVKFLAEPPDGFRLQESYPELGEVAANNLIRHEPYKFFKYNVQNDFPEEGRLAAISLADQNSEQFFKLKLQETYREEGKAAAKILAKTQPLTFFNYGLMSNYPEEGILGATKLAETNAYGFFSLRLHTHSITYENIGREAAMDLAEKKPTEFFYLKLGEDYSESEKAAATSLLDPIMGNPLSFFGLSLHEKYPDLEELAAKGLADQGERSFSNLFFEDEGEDQLVASEPCLAFFKFGLHKKYPEIGRGLAEWVSSFFYHVFLNNQYKILEVYPDLFGSALKGLLKNSLPIDHDLWVEENYPSAHLTGMSPLEVEERNERAKRGYGVVQKRANENMRLFIDNLREANLDEETMGRLRIVGRKNAEMWARNKPIEFFEIGISEKYPELIGLAVKHILKMDPESGGETALDFVGLKYLMENSIFEYAETKSIARAIAKHMPSAFFKYELNLGHPSLEEFAAKRLVEVNPQDFFDHISLQTDYPELIGRAAIMLSRIDDSEGVEFANRGGAGWVPRELPESGPIDYREELVGEDIDKTDRLIGLYEEGYEDEDAPIRTRIHPEQEEEEEQERHPDDEEDWTHDKVARLKTLSLWLCQNGLKKEAALINNLSSQVDEKIADQMEELEEQYFPGHYAQDSEDILDDMEQPGAAGVIYIGDEDQRVKGYLYGYQLVYEDEFLDEDISLEEVECFSPDCYDDINSFAEDMTNKAKNGEIFYVSNFLIDRPHRFKINDIIFGFLAEVKKTGYKYIAFEALSDTYKLIMKGDRPNASREKRYGITVLGKIGIGTAMFIARVNLPDAETPRGTRGDQLSLFSYLATGELNIVKFSSRYARKLGDVLVIKKDFPDADFWIWRTHNPGRPIKEYHPEAIGIKVKEEYLDQLDSRYLYYIFEYYNVSKFWKQYEVGTTIKSIRISDVQNLPLSFLSPGS